MPLIRPRRRLSRGAMLGGTAVVAARAGARAQERTAAQQAAEAAQHERLAALEARQAASDGSSTVAELTKLKALLDSGALTQAEFEQAKRRVLADG